MSVLLDRIERLLDRPLVAWSVTPRHRCHLVGARLLVGRRHPGAGLVRTPGRRPCPRLVCLVKALPKGPRLWLAKRLLLVAARVAYWSARCFGDDTVLMVCSPGWVNQQIELGRRAGFLQGVLSERQQRGHGGLARTVSVGEA